MMDMSEALVIYAPQDDLVGFNKRLPTAIRSASIALMMET